MTEIIKLIDYHTWATHLLTDQLLGFPEEMVTKHVGGSFPSIRLTMEHLLSADYLWMNRWKGTPDADVPKAWGTLVELISAWSNTQKQLKEAASVIAQRPEKNFKLPTIAGRSPI
jgi:uncharacterized damage-inducible protein DinB